MLWRGRKESDNVIDIRDEDSADGGSYAGGRRVLGRGLGIGPIILIGAAVYFLGGDPRIVLSLLQDSLEQGAAYQSIEQREPLSQKDQEAENELKKFSGVVLSSLEEKWTAIFPTTGHQFESTKLVIYRDATQTACGYGSSAAGPFYCPGDRRIYLDLGFVEELNNLGARGDFALAYVLAHEFGHHIQTLLGSDDKLRQLQERSSTVQSNALQVAYELQADCYAGVWAYHANQESNFIEDGDIEEGIQAAASVGDDRILKRAGRRVNTESFTHGSAADRMKWFSMGFKVGDVRACKT
jgi:predicted metalloprotease